MKWRVFLAFLFALTFMFLCTSAGASRMNTSVKPLEQSNFRPVPTIGVALPAATATPLPTPSPRLTSPPKSAPAASSRPGTSGSKTVLRGEASWGYGFKGHVVTRYKRGTIIRVCGSIGCTGKVKSWGYGPAKRTGRIADLDVNVFEDVCGPRSMGTCQIKLEVWK